MILEENNMKHKDIMKLVGPCFGLALLFYLIALNSAFQSALWFFVLFIVLGLGSAVWAMILQEKQARKKHGDLKKKLYVLTPEELADLQKNQYAEECPRALYSVNKESICRDSGNIRAFKGSGRGVLSTHNFFKVEDVGKVLKWDSGEESLIVGYVHPFSVRVEDSGRVLSCEFTIWNVKKEDKR